MKKRIDSLILDVDGTLWDSTGLVAKAWTQAVRQGGIELRYMKNTEEIMKKRIDSLILDVDGTLWDSTGLVAKAWTQAVRQGGIEGYSVEGEQLKQLFGKTMEVIAREMFPDVSQEQRDKLMELCCEYEHRVLCEDECAICYNFAVSMSTEYFARMNVQSAIRAS